MGCYRVGVAVMILIAGVGVGDGDLMVDGGEGEGGTSDETRSDGIRFGSEAGER